MASWKHIYPDIAPISCTTSKFWALISLYPDIEIRYRIRYRYKTVTSISWSYQYRMAKEGQILKMDWLTGPGSCMYLYVSVCIVYVSNAYMYVSVCICMYLYVSILCQWLRENHKALMHIHTHTCKYIYTHEAEGISDNFQPRHLLLEHHEGVAEGISVPIHGRPAGCKLWVHVSDCICIYLYVSIPNFSPEIPDFSPNPKPQ